MTFNRCVLALALTLLAAGQSIAAEPAAPNQPPPSQTPLKPPVPPVEPAQALRALQREHDALLARQPALQEATERATTLARQNQQLEQQVQALQAQVDGLREEAAALRADDRRRWFATGAGVLVAGIVLGLLLPALRGRRRRGHGGFR